MYARLLVPIDGSRTARRGLDQAVELARALGASLRLLHVVDARRLVGEPSGHAGPQRLLQEWRTAGEALVAAAEREAGGRGVAAEGVVRCDPACRVSDLIVREARACGAGLIVMGTHGRRGLHRLALGSDAETVLRESPVPVMLVRAQPGDEDPA